MMEYDELPINNNFEEVNDEDLLQPLALPNFAENYLKTAESYLGVSRSDNLPQVARFLSLFDFPTKINNVWVPFCAAGASYSALKTFCILKGYSFTEENAIDVFKSHKAEFKSEYFLPSPSCGQIMQDAQKRNKWMKKDDYQPNPGDLVLYNWKGGTWPEHIGIIQNTNNKIISTIEFNTSSINNINGGAVNKRQRNLNCVLGYVKL